MSINIKNERVSGLVMELAEATDLSITAAIGMAVEEKLARLRQDQAQGNIAEQLRQIGKRCRQVASKDWLERDFDAELYGDDGLPR